MKKGLLKDDRGSAMLTTIIVVLFIAALAFGILSASYMGYSVTLAQKADKTNFYSAETAMDQIRAGVHDAASEALAAAYTQTLKTYPAMKKADPHYDVQAAFGEAYVSELKKTGLVQSNSGGAKYSALALLKFTSPGTGVTLRLNGVQTGDSADAPGSIVVSQKTDEMKKSANSAFTLKGVTLTYIEKGYETNISSDISLKVPDFSVSVSMPHSLKEFSIIADTALTKTTPSGSSTISGNVFAGSVNVEKNDNTLTFQKGELLSPGNISASDGGSVHIGTDDAGEELWAKGITLSGGSFQTAGAGTAVYIQNDLAVTGAGSSVTLAGSYTGFGSDTAGTKNADKDSSSSILIGGKNTTLDFSALTKLSLAGISFIDRDSAIPMGQSVAVKSDQLAYLVPAECLGSGYPTNPCYFAGDTQPSLRVYTDTALWPNSANPAYRAKTITDYLGAETNAAALTFQYGKVETRIQSVDSTQHVAFAFLIFTNQSRANDYFRDYCAANPANITQYLSYYLSGGKLSLGTKGAVSAGETYSYNGSTLNVNDASAGFAAAGPWALYQTKKLSPYSSIVKKEPGGELIFRDADKHIVAIVTNGDFTYSGQPDYSHLKLIVSTGVGKTVTISSPFTGVVIAKGMLAANADITPDMDWDTLLKSTCGDETLSEYIAFGYNTGTGASSNSWDIDDLVVYENWHKS